MKEEHNGVLSYSDDSLQHINYQGKDIDNSVLMKKEGDGFWTTSEFEHSKVVNHVIKDTESGGIDSPNGNDLGEIITSQADSNLYTDKSVMECKDIDCLHVKDICVDKGEPLEEKDLIDKHTDNFVGPHVSKPSGQCGSNETTENNYNEFHIAVDRCESKEERNVKSPVLSEPEYKIEKYGLVEETLVTTTLPLEKFGTRSFLRSFMDSLNSQGDEDSQRSNQNMKPDPKNSEAELKSEESRAEDVLDHNYQNLPDPPVAHVVQHAYIDEREQEYSPNSEFRNSYNPFFDSENVSADKDRSTIDAHHETLLKNKEVQSAIVEVVNHEKENFNPFMGNDTENVYQVSAESPTGRSTNNPFTDCEDANADMDKNYDSIDHKLSSLNPFTSSDVQGTGPDKHSGNKLTVIVPEQQYLELRHLLNHEGAPKNASSTDHGEAGLGETSFAAVSGRITYSGPIAVSGSTSLRSDSSTTSTRSFAFPVLQSEWNSSPVRMERADRRKQRGGWKHGILCCKF